MILIPFYHAYGAVHKSSFPCGIIGQRHVAVTFLIGFVHNVQAVVVEQSVHFRVVGIMARADGVQVMAFKQQYVLNHAFHRDGFSILRMNVVAVGSFK